nr:GldG family protein [Bdellovibrionales bacterium]
MNWKSKIALLIAALCLVAAVALQFMTGMWLNLNSLLLAGAVGGVAAAAVLDWKLYFDFFTMRATKHGMNMGPLILLTFTGLICVNYLANKHNKSWDVTKERLNSLSEQSVTLLKGLKDDVRVTVFYKGPAGNEERQKIQQSVITYQDQTPHLKAVYHNAYVDSAEAIKYLTDQPDRETAPVFMFLEHGAKKARVDAPFDEAQITSGLIKVTRQAQAKIYFVQGHGEKDLEGADDQSLKDFGAALGEASFVVQSLNLLETKTLPKDGVIAIVGPQVPYLDGEIQMLREFARGGGRLFLALDPGVRHNLANLTKTFGVEFTNNYVLPRMPIQGGGPATVLGRTFDAGSDIPRS